MLKQTRTGVTDGRGREVLYGSALAHPPSVYLDLPVTRCIRLRRSPWTATILNGINIAALALIAGVLIQLGQSSLIDVVTWGIAVVSLAILLRFKINSVWLIVAGAAIGVVRFLLI